MRETRSVDEVKAVPPDEAAYHFIVVPVATKSETLAEPQNDCGLVVGAAGIEFIVTTTPVLLELSQPLALV